MTEEECFALVSSIDPRAKRLPPALFEMANAIEARVRAEFSSRWVPSPDAGAMCVCGDRLASLCDEEWGPDCDLGNNAAHARVSSASCIVPPNGWICTRPGGHTGPRTAWPVRSWPSLWDRLLEWCRR